MGNAHEHHHPDDGGGGSMMTMSGGGGGMMMHMYFTAGTKVTILFDGWTTQNAGQLFGSVIAIMLMAIFHEVLKVWRERLAANNVARMNNRIVHVNLPTTATAEAPS